MLKGILFSSSFFFFFIHVIQYIGVVPIEITPSLAEFFSINHL